MKSFVYGVVGALRQTAVVGVLLACGWAQAQTGTVRLLVGFPPGGGTDAIARTLADKLKDQLGMPVLAASWRRRRSRRQRLTA